MTTEMSKVRTMEFIGVDDWDRPVYKCIETGELWKDVALGEWLTPTLYSCGNEFDGEPCSPIKYELKVVFKTKYEEDPHKFQYMMLSRLKSDCDYYLGYGHRNESRLWEGNVTKQITEMKRIWNALPDDAKPERLTYEEILNYEKQMNEPA